MSSRCIARFRWQYVDPLFFPWIAWFNCVVSSIRQCFIRSCSGVPDKNVFIFIKNDRKVIHITFDKRINIYSYHRYIFLLSRYQSLLSVLCCSASGVLKKICFNFNLSLHISEKIFSTIFELHIWKIFIFNFQIYQSFERCIPQFSDVWMRKMRFLWCKS